MKKLLLDLAEAEKGHESIAVKLGTTHLTADAKIEEGEAKRRLFLLQVIQPGLVGLMDGSVSTLAPLFAAAFATHSTWETFLVGTAASVGAGISMGLAEGLSDDGKLTGRGHPLIRGLAAGIMTAVGGLGPCAALSHSGFLGCDLAGHRGGFRRTLGDLVDPLQVHGYALPEGSLPNRGGRFPGVPDGHTDRQRLRAQASLISTAPTTISAAPARRGRLTVSFSTRIDSSITIRMLVSRSAATLAMGALVMAQMAIQ